MTSNVNNFNSIPIDRDTSKQIFSYLPAPNLLNVALTSKEMCNLSHLQRLKKAQEKLEKLNKFSKIIQLPPFNTKSDDLKVCNISICSLQKKIKSIPIVQEILAINQGDFGQIAQEIQDRDLVIVLKQIAPPEIQQQLNGLSNFQAATVARKWLKDLDPQDIFFQKVTLDLRGLKLASIPPEIFAYFPHLQILDLSNNQIQVIPPEIGQLLNLQGLGLAQNQIQIIPPEIVQLQILQGLDLENNQIQVIPPEMGRLPNLQALSLANNQIQAIPQLPNLHMLNLSSNQIKIIPPEIGQLPNLQALSLANNQIKIIPPEIGQLPNLQFLLLYHNQIQVIPPEIGQLPNLEELDLSNNQIQVISPEIEQLPNLQRLKLGHNQIKVIPPEIGQLPNLRWLNLDDNQIQIIPSSVMRQLHFIIRGNPIGLSERAKIVREWASARCPPKIICASICLSTALILFQMLYRDVDKPAG